MYNILSYTRLKMLDINWYSIQDLYTIEKYKINGETLFIPTKIEN